MLDKDEFKRKWLLVLGNSAASCEIVRIAQRLGAYDIATDYLEIKIYDSTGQTMLMEQFDITAFKKLNKKSR